MLLADDHPVVRWGLTCCLSSHAHLEVVGEAADGLEALRKARELHPDVILMDLRMPGMDGLTAIRHIRARQDAKARLPVVVITADDGLTIDEDCLAAGADKVLHKPVALAALFDAIGAVLPKDAAASPSAQ